MTAFYEEWQNCVARFNGINPLRRPDVGMLRAYEAFWNNQRIKDEDQKIFFTWGLGVPEYRGRSVGVTNELGQMVCRCTGLLTGADRGEQLR
jgi:hypothetical protein